MIMKNKYRRKYNWNLFGKHCGLDIIGRLDWINGKPMVWVGVLNFILIVLNYFFKKTSTNVAEVNMLISHWGWYWFNLISKIVFWILFVDGVIVKILWSYTRGKYHCSYFAMLIKYPEMDNKAIVKNDLAWAHFLHTHPEFDYKLEALKNKYTTNLIMQGKEADVEGFQREYNKLVRDYGVQKDEKGRYFTWDDKKYRKMLEKL